MRERYAVVAGRIRQELGYLEQTQVELLAFADFLDNLAQEV